MAIPNQVPVPQELIQDFPIDPYKEGEPVPSLLSPSIGSRAGFIEAGSGGRGGYVSIVAEWLGQPAQPEKVRFEAIYRHSCSLPFLIFPDVIAQMLAQRGFHHSSPLFHRIALMVGLYRAI